MAGQPAGTSLKRRLKELRNIPQLRVILDLPAGHASSLYGGPAQLCYHVLGLVHAMWTPVPGAIKDFIATPKSNGYKVCPRQPRVILASQWSGRHCTAR